MTATVPAPEPLFAPATPTGKRLCCVVCGATGYGGWGEQLAPWQRPHLHGHAPCPGCGKQMTLKADGTPRAHARCPNPPRTDGAA